MKEDGGRGKEMIIRINDDKITDETVNDWNELFYDLFMFHKLEDVLAVHLKHQHRLQSGVLQDIKQYCKKVVMDVERIEGRKS